MISQAQTTLHLWQEPHRGCPTDDPRNRPFKAQHSPPPIKGVFINFRFLSKISLKVAQKTLAPVDFERNRIAEFKQLGTSKSI